MAPTVSRGFRGRRPAAVDPATFSPGPATLRRVLPRAQPGSHFRVRLGINGSQSAQGQSV
jgi:hypothetical protein